jgi:hypothetical protein
MDEEDKKPYVLLADADKIRYEKAKEAYVVSFYLIIPSQLNVSNLMADHIIIVISLPLPNKFSF